MANDCKPRSRVTPATEVGVPLPGSCMETVPPTAPECMERLESPGSECCPDDSEERGWYNARLVLSCPFGSRGGGVVVERGRFFSSISQEVADADAQAYAESLLSCIWWNTEQIVICPEGSSGNPVIVPADSFSSTVSQADADAKAISHGETLLECRVVDAHYYELPFYHYLNVDFDTIPVTMIYAGRVKVWDTGTIEFAGHIRCTRSGYSYRVWVGPTDMSGAYHVVGTTSAPQVWQPVSWAYRPPLNEYVYSILGVDINGGGTWRQRLWSFADGGWSFPIRFDGFQTSSADMDGTITRSATEITCTGTASKFNGSCAWDWWSSVTPMSDPATWEFSGYSGAIQVTTPIYTTTAPMLDSATVGVYARWYSGSPTPTPSDVTRLCSVGPFYRPTYDPLPQVGIDPVDP